ncbi:MAG TPA: hypothetical protein VFP58_05480 [Candidatus Eisenbacteria bacterium]|nr:hypothetical protein [Candidatus Eisenbacteria bacterium]
MPRWFSLLLIGTLSLTAGSGAHAALLSLTVIGGVAATDGSTVIPEGIAQETLSGSTLTQLGSPVLFDPGITSPLSLSVRLTNISAADILFPDLLPGVSVLSGVNGIPGQSARTNVAAGGNARPGSAGAEGAVSRTAFEMTEPLDALSSAVVGSHGGGGGAATGVLDSWVSLTGASGAHLATFLAGRTLRPGESIDIEGFAWIQSFGRSQESARIAFGLDLPTFSSGGVSVTTGAWTGSFTGPAPPGEEETPPGDPVAASAPGTLGLLLVGLGVGAGRRGFLARGGLDRLE